jgi:DNA polymerase III subunit epsilon
MPLRLTARREAITLPAMLARETTITVLDFETTGAVRGWPEEPWQIGLISLRGGVCDVSDAFVSLLRIGDRPFNPRAPGRHALLRDRLAVAPEWNDLWPALRVPLAGRPLAAHHTATEKKFLLRAAPLHAGGPWIDTLKLARYIAPRLTSYALGDLIAHFGLQARLRELAPGGEYHDALFDAVACGVLLEFFLRMPGWSDAHVEQLASAHPFEYHARATRRRNALRNRPEE